MRNPFALPDFLQGKFDWAGRALKMCLIPGPSQEARAELHRILHISILQLRSCDMILDFHHILCVWF